MNTTSINLIKFLNRKQQFTIPIYQRTYSWRIKQCEKLWEDIINSANNENVKYHFLGSVVSIKKGLDTSEISQQTIIDGQQRLTTITLLLCAIQRAIKDDNRTKELKEDYLINKYGKGDLKYKMLLTQQDKDSLIHTIENRFTRSIDSERIKENYNFFSSKILNENPEKVFSGIRKLVVVDITLDQEQDNPQLIFESLNSTGLALTQADLIRNFFLMGLVPDIQKKLYQNYWYAMEIDFGQANYTKYFDSFMRDYLTLKTGSIPKINHVYETFKKYFFENGGADKVNDIIEDIHKYSTFFVKMHLGKEKNKKLKMSFIDLRELNVGIAYPFLLQVYNDYNNKLICENIFLEVLTTMQSYLFRRFICSIPTNSLNKTFAS